MKFKLLLSSLLVAGISYGQCLSSTNTRGGVTGVTSTCGNADIDDFVYDLVDGFNEILYTSANVHFYDDSDGPNAKAVKSTGDIYIGIAFLNEALDQDSSGTGLAYIIAHEMGHIFQYEDYDNNSFFDDSYSKNLELQADFLAAYLLGNTGFLTSSNFKQMIDKCIDVGDYAFQNEDHHGVPYERVNAAIWGYEYRNEDIDTAYNDSFEKVSPDLGDRETRVEYICYFDNGTVLYVITRGAVCTYDDNNGYTTVGQLTANPINQANTFYYFTINIENNPSVFVGSDDGIYTGQGYKIGYWQRN